MEWQRKKNNAKGIKIFFAFSLRQKKNMNLKLLCYEHLFKINLISYIMK